MKLGIAQGMVTIAAAAIPDSMPDTDPQILYVNYASLYPVNPYIADQVKLEVSVRSVRTPYESRPIISMLDRHNPNPNYSEQPFFVDVVHPRKTMMEKVFLLHEEFNKPDPAKIRSQRMSRHLYDLSKLMQTNIIQEMLGDTELYNHLIQHRQWYSKISWVDYETLKHPTIAFLPTSHVIEAYAEDYQTMEAEMIYVRYKDFQKVLDDLQSLQDQLRAVKLPQHEANG